MSERTRNQSADGGMPQIHPDVSAEQLYLSANFAHVAAIAWNGFCNRGRGAVLLTGMIPYPCESIAGQLYSKLCCAGGMHGVARDRSAAGDLGI